MSLSYLLGPHFSEVEMKGKESMGIEVFSLSQALTRPRREDLTFPLTPVHEHEVNEFLHPHARD